MNPSKMQTKRKEKYHCPLDYTIEVIGGRWKPVVLWWIAHDFQRFSELQAVLPSISKQVLSRTLKSLETAGLLQRNEIRDRPKQVVYEVTEKGDSILPLMDLMSSWALEQLGDNQTFGYERSLLSIGIDVDDFKAKGLCFSSPKNRRRKSQDL